MSYFVGIDPSLGGCGVVVLDTTGKVVTAATIKSKPAETPIGRAKRYAMMCQQILAILPEELSNCFRIEGYSFGSQGRAITGLAEFRGTLLHTLRLCGYEDIEEVPPSSLKMFLAGTGKASKEDMLAAALEHGFDCGKDHNQADAYALAAWAHQGMKTKPKVKKPRKVKVPKVKAEKFCQHCKGTKEVWHKVYDSFGEYDVPSPCPKCVKGKKKCT